MGDTTPSQMLRDIQKLAGTDVPETMVRGLWMKKLPTYQPLCSKFQKVNNLLELLLNYSHILQKLHATHIFSNSSDP